MDFYALLDLIGKFLIVVIVVWTAVSVAWSIIKPFLIIFVVFLTIALAQTVAEVMREHMEFTTLSLAVIGIGLLFYYYYRKQQHNKLLEVKQDEY